MYMYMYIVITLADMHVLNTLKFHMHAYVNKRYRRRKKQARSYKQQSKATQHTQGSHFSKKNELPRVGLDPRHVHARVIETTCVDTCTVVNASLNVPTEVMWWWELHSSRLPSLGGLVGDRDTLTT